MRCNTPQPSFAKMRRHYQLPVVLGRALVLLMCLSAFFARAQYDLYMLIPGIPGESQNITHTNWIDLDSFSEQQLAGLITPGVKSYGFALNKQLDKSTPTLLLRLAQQTKLPTVHLQAVDVATNNLYDIYLTNAVMKGFSQTGSDQILENLYFSFDQIRWTYTYSGGKQPVSASEDLTQTNNPLANKTYQGNGSSSSGGAIGGGTLVFTNDTQTIYGTFSRGAGTFSNALVLYIDNGSGGFSDTSGFNDSNDPITRAISGIDGSGDRSLLTFTNAAKPFTPSYAIALAPFVGTGSGNIYRLQNGGVGSEQLIGSAHLLPLGTGNANTYTFSFGMAQVGMPPFNGQTFRFLGTYVDTTGARSTEAIGGNVSGTAGWNPFATVDVATYTITAPAADAVAISLTYDPQAGNITFSWPVTSTPYVLQQNGDLSTNLWTTVTNTPTVVSNQNQVVISASVSSANFYRLKY